MELQSKTYNLILIIPLLCFSLGLKLYAHVDFVFVVLIFLIISSALISEKNKNNFIISIFCIIFGMFCAKHTFHKINYFNKIKQTSTTLFVLNSAQKNDENHTIFGTAIILSSENKITSLENIKCYFILKNTNNIEIIKNSVVQIQSDIEFTSTQSKKSFLQYLANNNIRIYLQNGIVTSRLNTNNPIYSFFNKTKLTIGETLHIGIKESDKQYSNITEGMLTGIKNNISRHDRALFTDNGVAHIFAVSGLHIGIIASVISFMCKLLNINRKARSIPVLFIIILYANIIGAPASAIRAVTMVAFYYLAIITNRRPNILSALINSCFLWLIINPYNIDDIGFLMSHVIVAGLLIVAPIIYNIISTLLIKKSIFKVQKKSFSKKLLFILVASISTSLSAEIVSAPLSIEYFGQISKFSVLINIVAIPIASVSIIFGTLSLISAVLHLNLLIIFFNKTSALLIKLILLILNLSQNGALKFKHNNFQNGLLVSIIILGIFYFSTDKLKSKKLQNNAT